MKEIVRFFVSNIQHTQHRVADMICLMSTDGFTLLRTESHLLGGGNILFFMYFKHSD